MKVHPGRSAPGQSQGYLDSTVVQNQWSRRSVLVAEPSFRTGLQEVQKCLEFLAAAQEAGEFSGVCSRSLEKITAQYTQRFWRVGHTKLSKVKARRDAYWSSVNSHQVFADPFKFQVFYYPPSNLKLTDN